MFIESSMNRRRFLKLSVLSAVGAALAACAQPTPQIIEKEVPVEKVVKETVVVEKQIPVEKTVKETVIVEKEKVVEKVVTATPEPAKFKEAPMLAELVKAGKLPPVDERLPSNPCVCPVMEGIGNYGGTMRRGFSGVSDGVGPGKINNEGLTWYNADLTLRANIAEAWEINSDASQWTFRLRKGLKWSDGQPFTSDDFKWYYDNQLMNTELTTGVSTTWSTGTPRKWMTMEYPDKYTVICKFSDPNPLFAYTVTRSVPASPGHYLKQFHKELVSDKAAYEKAWKDAKFNDWQGYFGNKNNANLNPDRPTYGPWFFRGPISEEMFTMERNPYFWQVDSAGNQLPYLDKITHRLFGSLDVFNMWILNGEIDFQARHVATSNYTLFKEGEAKGGYRVLVGSSAAHHAISMNQGAKDPKISEFFGNRDVRIALNLCVNREEINEMVYDGLATPKQYSPLKRSPQYREKDATAYIQYDPKKANELLDKAGYDKRGPDGFRLWKDGSGTLSFVIESLDPPGSANEQVTEMVIKYMADVGVKATRMYSERSLYESHSRENAHEAADWTPDRTLLPIVAPFHWIATIYQRPWAGKWGLWYINNTDPNGEPPPEGHFAWKIWEIWDKVKLEPDEKKRTELFYGILDIWAEEVPYLGILGEIPALIIVKNGFKGYPAGYPLDDTTEDEQLLNPQTYYWDEPSKHA